MWRSEQAAATASAPVISSAWHLLLLFPLLFLLLLLRLVPCILFLTPSFPFFLLLLLIPAAPRPPSPAVPLWSTPYSSTTSGRKAGKNITSMIRTAYHVFVFQLRSDRHRKRNETDLWYDLPWGGKWLPLYWNAMKWQEFLFLWKKFSPVPTPLPSS